MQMTLISERGPALGSHTRSATPPCNNHYDKQMQINTYAIKMQWNMYPAQLQCMLDLIKVLKQPIKERGRDSWGKGRERWMGRQCSSLAIDITLNINHKCCDCLWYRGCRMVKDVRHHRCDIRDKARAYINLVREAFPYRWPQYQLGGISECMEQKWGLLGPDFELSQVNRIMISVIIMEHFKFDK